VAAMAHAGSPIAIARPAASGTAESSERGIVYFLRVSWLGY
jgi:hypothetical protein